MLFQLQFYFSMCESVVIVFDTKMFLNVCSALNVCFSLYDFGSSLDPWLTVGLSQRTHRYVSHSSLLYLRKEMLSVLLPSLVTCLDSVPPRHTGQFDMGAGYLICPAGSLRSFLLGFMELCGLSQH